MPGGHPEQALFPASQAADKPTPQTKSNTKRSTTLNTKATLPANTGAAVRTSHTAKRMPPDGSEARARLRSHKRAKLTQLAVPPSQESDGDDEEVENQQVLLMQMINTMMQVCAPPACMQILSAGQC
jgi:hypothetical protein